jgi:tungstate transport system ATP-binding protein
MRLVMQRAEITRDGNRLIGPLELDFDAAGPLVLMGHNGAGKSLLLRLAHGIVPPDSGSVSWDGETARTGRAARSFVFQKTPLLRRSVLQNVLFALDARGTTGNRTARAEAAIAKARLSHRADAPAAVLSGGEVQRLALARALVTEPAVVFLDEPSANLDPAATQELEALIRSIVEEGVQVIMSTHDIGQARRLASHVALLSHGTIAEWGPADHILTHPSTPEAQAFLEGRLSSLQGNS